MTMHVCGFEILTRNFLLFNDIQSTNVSKKQNDNNHEEHCCRGRKRFMDMLSYQNPDK
jgi:hypothetical protein